MRLVERTDFALCVLLLLALEPETLHTMSSIARRYRISKNHLSKVCATLKHKGYIDAVRGRSGGLRLKTRPDRVNLGSVVRDLEQDFVLVGCFDQIHNTCVLTPACTVQRPLQRALAAFWGVLNRTTLAELIGQRRQANRMRQILAEGRDRPQLPTALSNTP